MKQKRNYTRRKKQNVKRRNNKLRKHTRRNYTRRNYKTKRHIKRGGGKVDCCDTYEPGDILGLFVIKTNHKYTPHVAVVLKLVSRDKKHHSLVVKNMGTTSKMIDKARSILPLIGNAEIGLLHRASPDYFDNNINTDDLVRYIDENPELELFEQWGPGTGAELVERSEAYPFPSLTFKPSKLKINNINDFDDKYEPKKYSVWAAGFRRKFDDIGILGEVDTATINCWVYTMALYHELLPYSVEYQEKES